MKNLYPNTIRLIGCLLLAALFQSCGTKPGVFKNDEISSGKRDEFHSLNTQLINALRTKSKEDLKNLQSKEMLDDTRNQRKLELVGNRVIPNDYTILDEYYIAKRDASAQDTMRYDTVTNASAGINSYKYIFNTIAQETYVALLVPTDKTLANQDLIIAQYTKFITAGN